MIKLTLYLTLISVALGDPISPRVITGSHTTVQKHPYIAALVSGGLFQTTAVAISNKHLLTQGWYSNIAKHARFESNINNVGGRLVPIEKVIKHHFFEDDSRNYNYAIVFLAEEIELGTNITALEITEMNQDDPKEGEVLTVVGWSDYRAEDKLLREAEVPMMSEKDCHETTGYLYYHEFCAGQTDPGFKCYTSPRFQGGPCIYNNKVYGIASQTYDCRDKRGAISCQRIADVRDWIDETIKSN